MKKPNWKLIDKKLNVKPEYALKAGCEGFSTVSEAVHALICGKKYKSLVDISKALGMGNYMLKKYKSEMVELGVVFSKRPTGNQVVAQNRKKPAVKVHKKICHLINSVPAGTWAEPECDPFGLIRGFCK